VLECTESGPELSYVFPHRSWVTGDKLFLSIDGDSVMMEAQKGKDGLMKDVGDKYLVVDLGDGC
jgi:hypothetical protein